ncbi:SPOR domain-containing protein [Novosphingobium olei]|uniref:Tetratricopeptide repeat protein n=1 Tax=Novosphingobium olei TaxID=2728851 RepID=A0A7Y0G9D0_9SPHN|nr:SPOR domain-containing protein [Novosphingobium olei]NML92512.1 tetratricopeptide repeat protein [Novosphingobium olei]
MMRRTTSSPFAMLRRGVCLIALSAVPLVADAQTATTSQPVVQSTTGTGTLSPTQALNSALTRLARDPRNLTALIDAGTAALQLGDTDAAVGFFSRANEVAPGNGQVKAQIATAMLKADQPLDAIRYFDEAQAAGSDLSMFAQDRGLAYDLVGDNAAAQRLYQQAMARGSNDELVRRYALSLAIAGDRRGAETVLAPLIQRQDRAAWRARTFIMAISGNPDEAVSVAYSSMPQDLASGIAPYLRFMPRLTPAQQAAAANLGRFPRAADIGRDDPKVVQYAALHPRAPRVDRSLIPAGEALGGEGTQVASREKRRRPGRDQQLALATPAASANRPATSSSLLTTPSRAPATSVAASSVAVPVVQPTPVQSAPAQSATIQSVAGAGVSSQPQGLAAISSGGAGTALAKGSSAAGANYPLSRLDLPPGAPLPPRVTSIPVTRAPGTVASASGPGPLASAPASSVQTFTMPRQSVPAPAAATAATPGTPVLAAQVPSPSGVASSPSTTFASAQAASAPASSVAAAGPSLVASPVVQPTPAPPPATGAATTSTRVASVEAPPPPADFRALFDGFKAPEDEQKSAVAAVDLSTIRPRPRTSDAKAVASAKTEKVATTDAPLGARDARTAGRVGARGERPDGPTAVSRTTEKEVRVAQADDETVPGKGDKSAKGAKGTTGKDAKADKDAKSTKDAKSSKDAKSAKDAKGKAAPSHPSRIWVQVLTGGNRDQMGKEWRRLVKDAAVLKGRKPYLSPWRGNFRLLTGPFESDAAAQDFVKSLKKDGVSSYQWTSPAGQPVDTLPLD